MQQMFNGAKSFNQDLSARVVSGVAKGNFHSMFKDTALSVYHYNALLDSWSKQGVIASATNVTRTPLQYGGCEVNAQAGIEGHLHLTKTTAEGGKGWALSDGGMLLCKDADMGIQRPFITTWQVPTGTLTITIPTAGYGYSFEIDWGDGTTGSFTGNPPEVKHIYTGSYAEQVVTIQISGNFPKLACTTPASVCQPLRSVEQWGDIVRGSMANAFQDTTGLVINAMDTPNLSKVTLMTSMFQAAVNLTGNFSGWDTSTITNMSSLFNGAVGFNQPLDSWDTSSVTTMQQMFNGATSFNQPLPSWNTSNVTDMQGMFNGATSFDQDLSAWDVSKVIAANFTNMLQNTALSVYHYNALLDSWSKQNVIKNATTVTRAPLKYGGCEVNAQAGIEGHMRLVQSTTEGGKGWTLTDGGLKMCDVSVQYPACDTPDITITSGAESYKIAACNVGASVAGTGEASYGWYFQRGNNFGFWNGIAEQTDMAGKATFITGSTQVDASTY
jgi:surface protein